MDRSATKDNLTDMLDRSARAQLPKIVSTTQCSDRIQSPTFSHLHPSVEQILCQQK